MEPEQKDILFTDWLSFFGKINASATHEINNVIGIIRELSGLMEDVLYAVEESHEVNVEKFKTISEKITGQTHRAEAIIKRLNRFAHTVDTPVKQFDAGALMKDVTDFSKRFATLKNVSLETCFPEGAIAIKTNPFFLFYAVFNCINLFINSSGMYSTVTISFKKAGDGIKITIIGPPLSKEKSEVINNPPSNYLINALNGEFETEEVENEHLSFILFIPEAND